MDTPRENSTHDSGVWLLDRIMNQMNAGVYITDVDTDEILFMNSGMKKAVRPCGAGGKNLLAGASKRDERALSLLPRAASAAGRPFRSTAPLGGT